MAAGRYLAFALVWICQLKDDYWQEQTGYTTVLAFIFILLPLVKMSVTGTVPPFNTRSLVVGAAFLLGAGLCFYLSLDEKHDPYRVLHGIAQVSNTLSQRPARPFSSPLFLGFRSQGAYNTGCEPYLCAPFLSFTNECNQLLVGASLFYLWQALPRNHYKKSDLLVMPTNRRQQFT